MAFEAYDRAEKKHRDDVDLLDAIARNVVASSHGDFMKALADAWLRADASNKWILMPAWAAIAVKYSLEAELEG